MKSIVLAIAALATVSSAALASSKDYTPRETEYYNSTGTPTSITHTTTVQSEGFAVAGVSRVRNFDRLNQISYENTHARH
ncbi:MAG: hypothetical protein HY245_10475 [Rhizobiales bacterium]|nr:hypothetical protein [Hyphomicrobiales bacterium]MBI3673822.1 hypothetical protein [Hyphomicrobiales bacterium]